MGNKYPLLPLADLVTIHDTKRKPITKSKRVPGIYPYYGASGITDYVEGYVFDGLYVLLAEDGDNLRTRNTPIAFTAKGKFWVNNHAHVLKGIDDLDTQYICYALKHAEIDSYISGSTRPKITQGDLKKIPVTAPPLKIRHQIAKLVNDFDQKIELNKQTNQTLEQMAQTLFKSWFVDFDPVFDNLLAKVDFDLTKLPNDFPDVLLKRAEKRLKGSRQLSAVSDQLKTDKTTDNPLPHPDFPSEFEYNEQLGWIPKGWEVSELSELINIKHGFAYKGEFFSDEETEDILLTPGNVSVGGGFKSAKYKYYNGPIVEEYIFNEGDVYVNMTDLSKASDTLGYPAVVPKIDGTTFHHNQRLGKVLFKEHNAAQKEFVYQVLCSHRSRNNVLGSATGTTVKHTSPTKILSLTICHSGGIIEGFFEKQANALYAKSAGNNSNNIELTKLRDTLLPKLISGELQIPDIKAIDVESA